MMWSLKLKPHTTGEFSMAVTQAQDPLEDQCEVFTSDAHTIVGVYDGHGGSMTSRFVKGRIIRRLEALKNEGETWGNAMVTAFRDIEAEFLVEAHTKDAKEVGSCCIVGVISKEKLYLANLGDSRAVMGTQNRSAWPQRLTTDHSLRDCGHRLEFWDKFSHVPDVVDLKNGSLPLAVKGLLEVTKSIGDFYLKRNSMKRGDMDIGNPENPLISAVPEVTERVLTPQDQFVIFASAGLWKVLSDEAAVKIVHENKRSGIAKRLIKAAQDAAAKKAEIAKRRLVLDDISVVVLFFDHKNNSEVTTTTTTHPVDINSELGTKFCF